MKISFADNHMSIDKAKLIYDYFFVNIYRISNFKENSYLHRFGAWIYKIPPREYIAVIKKNIIFIQQREYNWKEGHRCLKGKI